MWTRAIPDVHVTGLIFRIGMPTRHYSALCVLASCLHHSWSDDVSFHPFRLPARRDTGPEQARLTGDPARPRELFMTVSYGISSGVGPANLIRISRMSSIVDFQCTRSADESGHQARRARQTRRHTTGKQQCALHTASDRIPHAVRVRGNKHGDPRSTCEKSRRHAGALPRGYPCPDCRSNGRLGLPGQPRGWLGRPSGPLAPCASHGVVQSTASCMTLRPMLGTALTALIAQDGTTTCPGTQPVHPDPMFPFAHTRRPWVQEEASSASAPLLSIVWNQPVSMLTDPSSLVFLLECVKPSIPHHRTQVGITSLSRQWAHRGFSQSCRRSWQPPWLP